jgi:hypothetical protein
LDAGVAAEAKAMLTAMGNRGGWTIDALVEATGMTVRAVTVALTDLELSGEVTMAAGSWEPVGAGLVGGRMWEREEGRWTPQLGRPWGSAAMRSAPPPRRTQARDCDCQSLHDKCSEPTITHLDLPSQAGPVQLPKNDRSSALTAAGRSM